MRGVRAVLHRASCFLNASVNELVESQFRFRLQKKEFGFLYGYGMKLIKQGLLDIDTAKDIIKRKLIERTGKTPEEFDAWLGY